MSLLYNWAANDCESNFALGKRVPFEDLGLFELELIEGISDRNGGELLKAKPRILSYAATLPRDQKFKAFQLSKGIGAKTAHVLERYIVLP